MKRIRKKEQSIGILGKITSLFSNSNKDAYSCDYVNNKLCKIVTEENTDLDDYTETGTYYFNSNYTPTNIPTGVNGWLQVMASIDGLTVKQIWFRHGTINTNDYETYIRTRTLEGWSNWQRLMVENDLYYIPGDTFSDVDWWTAGYVTSGGTQIEFDIYLPKRLDNVSIELVSGKFLARGVDGYVEGTTGIDFKGNGISTSIYKNKGNRISIRVTKSTAFTGVANNTPVGIALSSISLKFK